MSRSDATNGTAVSNTFAMTVSISEPASSGKMSITRWPTGSRPPMICWYLGFANVYRISRPSSTAMPTGAWAKTCSSPPSLTSAAQGAADGSTCPGRSSDARGVRIRRSMDGEEQNRSWLLLRAGVRHVVTMGAEVPHSTRT